MRVKGRDASAVTRRGQFAAALAVVALTAAACGGDSSTGDDDSGAGSAAPAGAGTDATEPDSSATPPTGDTAGTDPGASPEGTLKIGVATNVQTFDPVLAAVAQEYYLYPVFDTLVRAEPDGTYTPALAESWQQPDANTMVLTIREGVKFSDGTPLDADAVVANFERGIATEASPSAFFFGNLESVSAVDESTVELVLARPSTSILSDLSRLPGMMVSPAAFDADPSANPVGAGGWTYDAGASNPGEVQVFRANPSYWDPAQVRVATVEMWFYENEAANNAMLSGQIDLIELRSEADRATFESAGFGFADRPNANLWYIQVMDTDGTLLAPMADARVRRALSMAIDREAFNQALQFGQGDPSPSVWLEGTPYYDAAADELAYDPDAARQLLADAGYADGFEVTFPSFGTITATAEAVQQMWAGIGVDVTIQQVEPGTLAAEMRSGNYAFTPTLARGFTAESQYLERLAPGSPYDPLGTDRGELATLADAAFNATDQAAQDAAWTAVYAEAVAQGYTMVIGHQIPTVVVADQVEGALLRPADNVPQPYGMSVG